MSKNLFDFGEENLENSGFSESKPRNYSEPDKNFSSNASNATNNNEEEVKQMYEKYKDYSQSDLTREFLSSSKQRLKEGSLTQEKINSTANALMPFLNETQKEMMYKLLEQLND